MVGRGRLLTGFIAVVGEASRLIEGIIEDWGYFSPDEALELQLSDTDICKLVYLGILRDDYVRYFKVGSSQEGVRETELPYLCSWIELTCEVRFASQLVPNEIAEMDFRGKSIETCQLDPDFQINLTSNTLKLNAAIGTSRPLVQQRDLSSHLDHCKRTFRIIFTSSPCSSPFCRVDGVNVG